MSYENYNVTTVEVRNRIAYTTINNPPVNIITRPLLEDLVRLSEELKADPDLLVVVLRSANPEFFIAHFDVAAILNSQSRNRRSMKIMPTRFTMICASGSG
jgi:enoyl-CoA hydratase/carnithine racemase